MAGKELTRVTTCSSTLTASFLLPRDATMAAPASGHEKLIVASVVGRVPAKCYFST